MPKKPKHIAVLTSGGDAPGMNAAIRSVVRSCSHFNLECSGVYRGYQGLIEGDIRPLNPRSVNNIINKGGTKLKSARSLDFHDKKGRQKAYENLKKHNVDALIIIGGDGSFTGGMIFEQEHKIPVIGVPGTIDNDIYGTSHTIGYDTALNTVVEAIDKIRDTAISHNRLFFVEVMGRDAGLIALRTGIAAGAEGILIPETPTDLNQLVNYLKTDFKKKRRSGIIIVAEGDSEGGAYEVAKKVQEQFPNWETKVTVLGHIQRGGKPNGFDRILASRMGHGALLALKQGRNREMIGIKAGKLVHIPIEKAIKHNVAISQYLLDLVKALS